MNEADADARVGQVSAGLLRASRVLDAASFYTLIGAIITEIQIGMDVAEERALEASHRRPRGTVVRFRPLARIEG